MLLLVSDVLLNLSSATRTSSVSTCGILETLLYQVVNSVSISGILETLLYQVVAST